MATIKMRARKGEDLRDVMSAVEQPLRRPKPRLKLPPHAPPLRRMTKKQRQRLESIGETVQAESKRVRIRLDFTIVSTGAGLPDFFGPKLLDFIEAGLQKTVPEAVAILPGSRADARLVRERKG